MIPAELLTVWRARADQLEPYAPPAAEAWRRAAEELEDALVAEEDALLPPGPSSAESGYSERTLREHVASGTLKNYGRPGKPLYRRGDLPRKPRKGDCGRFDADAHVAGIVGPS